MPLTFSIDVDGVRDAKDMYAGVSARATDLTPAWNAVLRFVRSVVKKQFETSGRFGGAGKGWDKLSFDTLKRKAEQNQDPRILRASGLLYNSLIYKKRRYGVEKITPQGLEYGTRHPAAGFHQEGTKWMKPRPIIQFPQFLLTNESTAKIADWVMRGQILA